MPNLSSNSSQWTEITLALAGVFQAASLVEQLAKTGYAPPVAFQCSIESLFVINPTSTESVFGNQNNLELGLKVLIDLLQNHKGRKHPDALRYVIGIIHLQKKLSKRQDLLSTISHRLEKASQQANHFSTTHENVIANLAGVYTDTLSTFKSRIHVIGNYTYLQQPRIANQVRALLLAGVRAAILWRQVGGNRWQFFLNRKILMRSADELMENIKKSLIH